MSGRDSEGPGACGNMDCPGGLSCLANHLHDDSGRILVLGWGSGDRLRVLFDPGPKGLCLYSQAHFCPGDPITIYDGHLVHKTASLRPTSPDYQMRSSHFHSMYDYVVCGFRDVYQGRGVGSLINHSFRPNAKIAIRRGLWPYHGVSMLDPTYLLVLCAKHISPGDEITIKYSKLTCSRLRIPYK